MNSLVDTARLARFHLIAIGIPDVAEPSDHPSFEAGFLAHLPQRRLIVALALLHMALGQAPTIAPVDQGDFIVVGVLAVDDAARGNFFYDTDIFVDRRRVAR